MRTKKGMVWGELLGMIVVLMLVFLYVYYGTDLFRTAAKFSECEGNGGICRAQCHFPDESQQIWSCDEKADYCCWDPKTQSGPQPKGEAVDPRSLAVMKPNHRIYVYTDDGKTVPANAENVKLEYEPGKTYTYYFSAEGNDVGVCYASVMHQKDGVGQYNVLDQGGEVRLRLDRKDCLKGSGSTNALSFYLNDAAYENDKFYLQFIVFDKSKTDDTTSAEVFEQESVQKGWWLGAQYRVADYRRYFTVKEFSCGDYDEDTCVAKTDKCVYCPSTTECLEGKTPAAKQSACQQSCLIDGFRTGIGAENSCEKPQTLCSKFDNNILECQNAENCVYCADSKDSNTEGRCLGAAGNTPLDFDAACKAGCYLDDWQETYGFYNTDQDKCSGTSCASFTTIDGCKTQSESCIYCVSTRSCIDVEGTKQQTCTTSCSASPILNQALNGCFYDQTRIA